eukprot:c18233_g1_i1 orf=440-1084(-)
MASLLRVVEHIVLFKAKEGAAQASLDACIVRFRALRELEGVVHLYAGAARTCQPEEGAWTHVLYGRYRDKEALEAYSKHPGHLQAVAHADPLFQDKMALDWEASVLPSLAKPVCATAHIAFVQWMHQLLAADLSFALSRSLAASLPSPPHHHTSGPNFSPARARGFDWGFAAQSNTCSTTPQINLLVETLAQDPSVDRFLCVEFATGEEIPARL